MASPGYHKQLISKHPKLEVKRAGKDWPCVGIFVERGKRPGRLKDVWMIGHSRNCLTTIAHGSLYVANSLLPPTLLDTYGWFERWLPTCLYCALETYSEFFDGPTKYEYLQPITPERQQQVVVGLIRMLDEAAELDQHEEVA